MRVFVRVLFRGSVYVYIYIIFVWEYIFVWEWMNVCVVSVDFRYHHGFDLISFADRIQVRETIGGIRMSGRHAKSREV